ncbi:MAG: DUF1800 domain-containing protein [Dinghuibacter sp.]|nr:DUF1800 domain-containing protein [Dinghuibacter sp.]
MDRREFLAAKRKKKMPYQGQPFQPQRNITSGIGPYTGPWSKTEVRHLLKRTMFGAKPADVAYFSAMPLSQAVNELLNPAEPMPAPPIKEYATSTTPGVNADGNIAQGTTWVNDVNNDGTVQAQRRASFKKWWVGNMINQGRSIREKMAMFLSDHFGTEMNDIGNGNLAYIHHNLVRTNALGNFKQLVRDMTTDPAMLRYLNGYLNTATAPDENYSRELQELFCLGKGPGSQYTEGDVKEAAKVLTGWQINFTNYTSVFTPARHSTVNKQFSSFYENKIITGRTGATAGALELADLLNMIFAEEETAKFIVRKIYRWFVYYTIDAQTETNVILPLADIFRNNNYELKPVLQTLFNSEHFFDMLNRGCVIKTPADLVIGSLREMNAQFPPLTDWDTNYGFWNNLWAVMRIIGQDLGDPPNVAGMPAYYQEPLFHELWITTDTLPKRNQFTDLMTTGAYTRNGQRLFFNLVNYVQTLPNPGNPNDLIDTILESQFTIGLSNESKRQIKTTILLSGQQYDYYWTNAWHAYIANPGNVSNFNTVNNRLKELFKYLMSLSEYQLS